MVITVGGAFVPNHSDRKMGGNAIFGATAAMTDDTVFGSWTTARAR
jgi:hypothetical protein